MKKTKDYRFLLSEQQLNAFYVVAQSGSFTKACTNLHLSQPALSRRISSLEDTLELNLFERTPTGIKLTEAGLKLIRYIENKLVLENEVLEDLKSNSETSEFSGKIRIAGHSSVVEPIVMPCLSDFLIANPDVQIELSVQDNNKLDDMLNYSNTDFILSNRDGKKKEVEQHLIGYEEYVCIESDKLKTRSHIYLDASPQDPTTEHFFDLQASPPKKYKRSFLYDENGITKGVQLGLGRAIKPKHTIQHLNDVKIVKGFVSLKKPIFIRYYKKQYYSKLEQKIIEILLSNSKNYL